MKKIKFTCSHCEAKLRVPTHLAGVSAPCPKCGATITAPSDITAAVIDAPSERRMHPAASAAPARARQQSGGTAVLEAPVSQAATAFPAAPAPAPVANVSAAPRQNPVAASIAAAAAAPTPVQAKAAPAAPSRSLPTPVPAAPVSEIPAPPAPQPVSLPVPPVLEQPPALQPVPSPVPPALFEPPAPVVAPAPMVEDERSAPPMPLDEESAVVVEELVYEMPPAPEPVSPLAPITQPIRVTPPSGELPIAREKVSAPGTLPRLDVSLAGQDPAGAAAILFGEGAASHQGRTRLVLPQPGTKVQAGSPGDFLVPPTIPTPPVPVPLTPPPLIVPAPEPVEDLLEEPVLTDYTGGAVDLLEPVDSVEPDLPIVSLPHYKTIPLPNETAPLSLDELEGAEPWEEEAVLENDAIFDPEGYLGAPAIAEWHETPDMIGAPSLDLPEGHERETTPPPRLAPPIAPNFSSDWPEIETAPIPVPVGGAPFLPAPEEEAELPLNPLHEGSFGRLFAQQAPPDQITPGPLGVGTGEPAGEAAPLPQTLPAPSDGDVLDELFYSTPREPGEKKGLSKTAIVVISSMVGVAIFASVGVYFAIKALGGLNPAEAYVEPEGSDPDSGPEAGGKLAVKPKGVTVPTSAPDPGINDAPAVIDPVAMLRDDAGAAPAVPSDPPAVSFDEKVQQAVNGTRSVGASVIGSPSLDLVDTPVTNFSGIVPSTVTTPPATAEAPAPVEPAPAPAPALDAPPVSSLPAEVPPSTGMVGPAAADTPPLESAPAPAAAPDAAPRAADPLAKKDPNFNPPASFAAPGPEDGPLGKTRDAVDAFLRSPDLESRLRYTYQGESLRAFMEDYYKKWPYEPFGRYSLQLNQIEEDTSIGGPYWVFVVATNDLEGGFPIIVRNENGLLKIDWEVFAEFSDRHFVRFRDGKIPPPATFRLILERFSDYYGSDKDQFKDLKDYYVYQVSTPYGDLNEFSDFAFVKKDSELAKKLDGLVRLGDQPLAVVATIDYKTFAHGEKHLVITELVTEGWFR